MKPHYLGLKSLFWHVTLCRGHRVIRGSHQNGHFRAAVLAWTKGTARLRCSNEVQVRLAWGRPRRAVSLPCLFSRSPIRNTSPQAFGSHRHGGKAARPSRTADGGLCGGVGRQPPSC